MKAWVQVEGLQELQSQLKRLPERIKKNELYRILRNVTGPVEEAMRSEVTKIELAAHAAGRDTTGNLYDAIGRIRGKSKEYLNVQVAPRVKGKYRGYHAHLVNFGTKIRKTRKGYRRGAARENNFAQRAWDRTVNSVKPNFEAQVAKSMERMIKQNLTPKV